MGLIFSVVALVILIGAVAGVAKLAQRSPDSGPAGNRVAAAPLDTERVFLSVLSFAGLVATLYALAGLLGLLLVETALNAGTLVSASDARERASYYLAALVVGLPIWLVCWTTLQRRSARSGEGRTARERRWFLGAVFGTTAVVALFGLHSLLAALLGLPGATDRQPLLASAVSGGARLLVWGTAWFLYARLGWMESGPQDDDNPHDLAVYSVTGFALTFAVIGAYQGLREVIGDLAGSASSVLLGPSTGSAWTVWGPIAAWLLSGGLAWIAIWQYALRRGRQHRWRVVYLYLVLVVAAPVTLASGTDTLYEVLRRIFGYGPQEATWLFLRDALPPLLLGAGVWAHHWSVLRRQARRDRNAVGVPWPRRPALVLFTLLGLALAAVSLTSLLWLELDFLLRTGSYLTGTEWWRDRLSAGLAGALVGLTLWLPCWSILQRAAASHPALEGAAPERRRFLGLVVLAGGLIGIGFSIAFLWLVFRGLLGGTLSSSDLSRALKDVSTVVVALTVAVYHFQVLRRDRRVSRLQSSALQLTVLVAPGAEAQLTQLNDLRGTKSDTVAYLLPGSPPGPVPMAQLADKLSELEAGRELRSVVVVLDPAGATLYPYTTAPALEATVKTSPDHNSPPVLDPSPQPLP